MTKTPQPFGEYELIRRIGVGGMAETFLAVRRKMGGFEQRVCLKRVLSTYNEDESFIQMFLQEARISAGLDHDAIVRVFDFGQVDGVYYMALELVEGMDLRALLRSLPDKKLPWEMCNLIAHRLLAALDYAHEGKNEGKKGTIVHRDISPSNVIISVRGAVKLTDFGIAKEVYPGGVSDTTQVKGKTAYMPPEQFIEKKVDARTDLFAVGVVIYEALTGRRPFDGPNELSTLLNITKGIYTPIRELCPEVPEALAQVVEKLLQIKPEDRYQRGSEAFEALPALQSVHKLQVQLGELVQTHRNQKEASVPLKTPADQAPVPSAADQELAQQATHTAFTEAHKKESPPSEASAPHKPLLTQQGTVWKRSDGTDPFSPSDDPAQSRFPKRTVVVFAFGVSLALGLLTWAAWRPAVSSETIELKTMENKSKSTAKSLPTTSVQSDAQIALSASTPSPSSSPVLQEDKPSTPTNAPATSSTSTAHSDSAVVRVRVHPFGQVWIDNELVGDSPYTGRVKAGTHAFGGGTGRQEYRKIVRIKAGKSQQVTLNDE